MRLKSYQQVINIGLKKAVRNEYPMELSTSYQHSYQHSKYWK